MPNINQYRFRKYKLNLMRLKKTGRFTLLLETDSQYHNDLIIDQFTKQAIPFTLSNPMLIVK